MVKQKKKNWKKIDVQEVEDALEDDRLTQKLRKVPDEELFSLDTLGSTQGLSRSVQKELKRAKDAGPKQRRYSPMELKKVEKAGKILRNRAIAAEKRATAGSDAPPKQVVFDLWGPAPAAGASAKPETPDAPTHPGRAKMMPKLLPQKTPGTMHQRTSKAPAVLVAHEGQSVNPTDEAFEELACTEAALALEKERETQELARLARPVLHALLEHYGHEEVKDMDGPTRLARFQALQRSGKAPELEGEMEKEEGLAPSKGKATKRKTQKERNKQRRAQLNRERLTEEQKQKQLLKAVGAVGALLKEMGKEEEMRKGKREYKAALQEAEAEAEVKEGVIPKKRRIGKHKYREAAKELPAVEDGAKTGLRQAKMLGSALKDRVQSVYRQGLLEMKPEATRQNFRRVQKRIRKRDKNRKFVNPLMKEGSLLLA